MEQRESSSDDSLLGSIDEVRESEESISSADEVESDDEPEDKKTRLTLEQFKVKRRKEIDEAFSMIHGSPEDLELQMTQIRGLTQVNDSEND